ncbi:MAG TPA: archease [Burkholderiaceae bacterium]|jgi:tRNA nucleotidyltransferase (CCA-adding enzyme)|nr:archease [Burkholderiaceae bacterium]
MLSSINGGRAKLAPSQALPEQVDAPHWEHFPHGADIGIRGFGVSKAQAFEQAALALTAVMTMPQSVQPEFSAAIHCEAADDEFLFLDWINALVFEMATRNMLFGCFHVNLDETGLNAVIRGEPVDTTRHHPAVEVKGATFTELAVRQTPDGNWLAQCVVDV